MAKQSYKIPADLDQSYLTNMEIAIQSKDGLGVKPLPVLVIMAYIGSLLLCFYICTNTVISNGSVLQIGLFIILWLLMTVTLAKFDKTKRMQAQLIPTLFNYIPRINRHVITRASSKANGFYSIAGIDVIDKDTGLVSHVDGTYTYWYLVVGSASVLLFDDDKDSIINRVDAFYRKLSINGEVIFITAKESQKVHRQIASLKRRYDNLEISDPDLTDIANEQFDVLKNHVGGSFKSIHQYMGIKGDSKEALGQLKNIVQSEVESSSLMIKQCVPLYYEDVIAVLSPIYKGEM